MMDSNQEKDQKEGLKMEGVEVETTAPPPVSVGGGVRRSRKLRGLPPGNPIEDGQGGGSGDGDYAASARKRARRQEVGEEVDILKGAAGGDEGVSVSAQVHDNPRAQVVSSSEGTKWLAKKKKNAQLKLKAKPKGGKKRGGASSSSIGGEGDGTGTRRSELESSEGFPKEEEAHPCLFIENILDVVFKHILNQPGRPQKDVAKDVQSVRLVCKTWTASATRAYRRTGPVTKFERYDRSNPHDWGTPLSDFMEMMKGCELIPVQKFTFGICAFQNETLELYGDFFRICGPEVTSLEVHISSWGADRLTRILKKLPQLNLPKLLRLEVQLSYGDQRGCKRQPELVGLIELLLTAATTLQEFGLSYPPPDRSSHPSSQVTIMQQLGQAVAASAPVSLKQLKLSMNINESTFGDLAESGLKLERFEFGTASKLVGSKTLSKFIQSQAPTLKSLRIWNPRRQLNPELRIGTDIYVEMPSLDQLVELELSEVILRTTASAPFDFSTSFPKLHRLNLSEMGSENAFRALLSSTKKPMESLKVLHFPVWYKASLAPLVKIAGRAFPSVTKLDIWPHKGTRETMEDVFRHFDNLESLHVSIYEKIRKANWVDSIFSGTSEQGCSQIKRSKDFGTVNLYAFQVQPSIHNLTKLRKLVVNTNSRNRLAAFSDFSAHFTFLEMDGLREIELAEKDVRFSPRYRDLLRDKLVFRD